MEGLFQPTHLLIILLVVLIVYRPNGFSKRGLFNRRDRNRSLWLAKGDRPELGRDVLGNTAMNSSHDKRTVSTVGRWLKFLIAVLLGNGLYFTLSPYLPPAARHQMYRLDLGTVVDLWFCLFVYGLVELAGFLERRRHGGV